MKNYSSILITTTLCFLTACAGSESPREDGSPSRPAEAEAGRPVSGPVSWPTPYPIPQPVPRQPVGSTEVEFAFSRNNVTRFASNSESAIRGWCYDTLNARVLNGVLPDSFETSVQAGNSVTRLNYQPRSRAERKTVYDFCETLTELIRSESVFQPETDIVSVSGAYYVNGLAQHSFHYSNVSKVFLSLACKIDDRPDIGSPVLSRSLIVKSSKGEQTITLSTRPLSRSEYCAAILQNVDDVWQRPTPLPTPVPTATPAPAPVGMDEYFAAACGGYYSTSDKVACQFRNKGRRMASAVIAKTCQSFYSTSDQVACLEKNFTLTVNAPEVEEVCSSYYSTSDQIACFQAFRDVRGFDPVIAKTCLEYYSSSDKKSCLLNKAAL